MIYYYYILYQEVNSYADKIYLASKCSFQHFTVLNSSFYSSNFFYNLTFCIIETK